MKTQKVVITIAVLLVVLVVAGFITKEIIRSVTEKITRDITEREVARITRDQVGRITQQETNRITAEETERITESIIKDRSGGIFGGGDADDYVCDPAPIPRQFTTTPYYTGPLIDTHLHMPSAFQIPAVFAEQADWYPPVLDQDITTSELVCVFDKGQVKSAFGFYLTTNVITGTSVNSAEKMKEKYAGRIVPFLMSPHLLNLDLTSEEIEEILKDHEGLFKGLGEIAFYRADYKSMSPEDPKFLKMYDLAKKYHLIVMIHPNQGQQQAMEGILQKYPEVTFLFHGSFAMRSYVAEIVAQYPNAYFTLDGELFQTIDDPGGVSLGRLVGKEKYITDLKREYEKIQRDALTRWKEAIEAHPDKFLWGTDRADLWNFDPEVSGLIEESSRVFIGQLDPAVQEKFAYKNAERLINEVDR